MQPYASDSPLFNNSSYVLGSENGVTIIILMSSVELIMPGIADFGRFLDERFTNGPLGGIWEALDCQFLR